jgi:PrgI family protein
VARTHEVPNHLNVQDTLFLGLTARQVATFMAFASRAYGLWDQLTVAPLPVRGTLAGLVVLAGIAFTLLRPDGRPLDQWATSGSGGREVAFWPTTILQALPRNQLPMRRPR